MKIDDDKRQQLIRDLPARKTDTHDAKVLAVVNVRRRDHSDELRPCRISAAGVDVGAAPLAFDALLSAPAPIARTA